eukprot:gene13058-14325_t
MRRHPSRNAAAPDKFRGARGVLLVLFGTPMEGQHRRSLVYTTKLTLGDSTTKPSHRWPVSSDPSAVTPATARSSRGGGVERLHEVVDHLVPGHPHHARGGERPAYLHTSHEVVEEVDQGRNEEEEEEDEEEDEEEGEGEEEEERSVRNFSPQKEGYQNPLFLSHLVSKCGLGTARNLLRGMGMDEEQINLDLQPYLPIASSLAPTLPRPMVGVLPTSIETVTSFDRESFRKLKTQLEAARSHGLLYNRQSHIAIDVRRRVTFFTFALSSDPIYSNDDVTSILYWVRRQQVGATTEKTTSVATGKDPSWKGGPYAKKQRNDRVNHPRGNTFMMLPHSTTLRRPILPCVVFVPDRPEVRVQGQAFIDTGSEPRNYIDPALAGELEQQGALLVAHTCEVCSPLSEVCSSCSGELKLRVTFKYKKQQFTTTEILVSVLRTGHDLVIGSDTIQSYDLTATFHELFRKEEIIPFEMGISSNGEIHDDTRHGESDSESKENLLLLSPLPERSKTWVNIDGTWVLKDRVRVDKPKGRRVLDADKSIKPFLPQSTQRLRSWLLILNSHQIATMEDEEEVNSMLPDASLAFPEKRKGTYFPLPSVEMPTLPSTPFHNKIKDLRNEFKDVFSAEVKPEAARLQHLTLEVDKKLWEVKGNRAQPRPQSTEKMLEMVRQVNRMLELDVIQRTSDVAAWSQVLLVPKPGGKWRFCIDFRNLNTVLVRKNWPIPNIKRMLHRLGQKKAKYYAIMDLTSGFHQCMIAEDSRKYTAFVTDIGTFRWKRVPMGISTAPAYFQQAIADTVMADLRQTCMEMYIDDMLIYGDTEEDFLENLRKVFERLQLYNITVNPAKCKLGLTEVDFVGHVVSSRGISMQQGKRKKIVEFPKPMTVKELRSFLGMANYFRSHVKNHSIEVRPLQNLILGKKGKRDAIAWTKEAEEAFSRVKDLIRDCPQLYYIDCEKGDLILETDASDYGIGAYLYQKDTDGKHLPVAFMSKALTAVERRWSTIEKEQYAIFRAFKEFEYLVRGHRLVVRTDHKNLTMAKDTHGKVARWKMALDTFDYRIEYVKGSENAVADNLSRILPEGAGETAQLRLMFSEENIPQDKADIIRRFHGPDFGHFGEAKTRELIVKGFKE